MRIFILQCLNEKVPGLTLTSALMLSKLGDSHFQAHPRFTKGTAAT